MADNNKSSGTWDSTECVLILIDYLPGVMTFVQSHDIKTSELNARYLTKAAETRAARQQPAGAKR